MTPVTSGLQSFQPERLRKVRKLVVDQHPGTASEPSTPSSSRLIELKHRVEEAAGDESALERLASELKPRDLRGVARAIGRWTDLRQAVVTIIEARPRRSLLRVLWPTWHGFPEVPELKAELQKFGREFGWEEVVPENYVEPVTGWVSADSPPVAIQGWLADQGLSYTDLKEVKDFPVSSDAPLHRKVRDAVMTHGSSGQLRREGAKRLLKWYRELDQNERMAFGKNYLESLAPNRWEPPVLEMLEGRYGLPNTGRERFWRRVSEESRTAFQRFFIQRNIEQAFGRGTDRDEYWKGRADDMVAVNTGTAGRTDFAVLDFGNFVVVEFFRVGNAAYFYTEREWEQIDASNPSHPSDLKDRNRRAPGRASRIRLRHHSSWERTADRMLRNWMRSTG